MFIPWGKGKKIFNRYSPLHFKNYFIPKCFSKFKNKQPDLKDKQFVFGWKT
jgi:hypothetical protein